MESCLSVEELTVRFGGVVAVDGVSFDVAKGEVLGVIGPNGAGKTTTFSAITGTVRVRGGRIIRNGRNIAKLKPEAVVKAGIARTFQLVQLFPSMTVSENVLVGASHDLSIRNAKSTVDEILDILNLTRFAKTAVRTLPLAVRKRTEVARALATKPEILLLDEMMNGLTRQETACSYSAVTCVTVGRDQMERRQTRRLASRVQHRPMAAATTHVR